MKTEIITMQDVQIIGMSREIAFCHSEECPKFWGEYVERIVRPVFFEHKTPDAFQQAAIDNNVGEFGLCTCKIPNHNCGTCGVVNFCPGNERTFTYVIGGTYRGGDVPEGMQLFPIKNGRWLKVHFVGGMAAYQQQYKAFHQEWLPAHPEYKCAPDASCLEWYSGKDIQSPDYQCGIMLPLVELTTD